MAVPAPSPVFAGRAAPGESWMRKLRAGVARAVGLRVERPLWKRDGSTRVLGIDPPVKRYGMVIGGPPAYPCTLAVNHDDGTWTSQSSGYGVEQRNAFEINGNRAVPTGTVQELWLSEAGVWYFQHLQNGFACLPIPQTKLTLNFDFSEVTGTYTYGAGAKAVYTTARKTAATPLYFGPTQTFCNLPVGLEVPYDPSCAWGNVDPLLPSLTSTYFNPFHYMYQFITGTFQGVTKDSGFNMGKNGVYYAFDDHSFILRPMTDGGVELVQTITLGTGRPFYHSGNPRGGYQVDDGFGWRLYRRGTFVSYSPLLITFPALPDVAHSIVLRDTGTFGDSYLEELDHLDTSVIATQITAGGGSAAGFPWNFDVPWSTYALSITT